MTALIEATKIIAKNEKKGSQTNEQYYKTKKRTDDSLSKKIERSS